MRRLSVALTFFFFFNLAFGQRLDSHLHLFSEENVKKIDDEMINAPISGFQAITLLDSAGVDKAFVLSAAYLLENYVDAKFENNFVKKESLKYERLIPFCSVRISASWALDEVHRCFRDLKLKGPKLHPQANSIDLLNDDGWEKFESIIGLLNQLQTELSDKFPIILDSNWQSRKVTSKIFHLSTKYPNINFVLAHALFIDRMDLELIGFYYQAIPKIPRNIFVDLSATVVFYEGSPDREKFLWVLRKFGIDRVLLGSDYPVFTPQKTFESLQTYGFNQAELDAIMGINALSLWDTGR